MRFVSNSPGLGLGTVIRERFVLALDGQRDQTQESVSVKFSQNGLTQDDIDFALSFFPEKTFTGRWLYEDGITLQPLAERIGVFDTTEQGWDEETREKAEAWMLAKQNYGKDFVQVVPVVREVAKPWPSYNNTHHFKVAELAAELGLVPEALAYERANKNRAGVVEKLEEKLAISPKAAEETGEVVAA